MANYEEEKIEVGSCVRAKGLLLEDGNPRPEQRGYVIRITDFPGPDKKNYVVRLIVNLPDEDFYLQDVICRRDQLEIADGWFDDLPVYPPSEYSTKWEKKLADRGFLVGNVVEFEGKRYQITVYKDGMISVVNQDGDRGIHIDTSECQVVTRYDL